MIQRLHRSDLGYSLRSLMENDPAFRPLAYFSMEVGLKETIPTYSGGLGVLAGDILKSAADLGVPMAGVTLLYRKGLFRPGVQRRRLAEGETRPMEPLP